MDHTMDYGGYMPHGMCLLWEPWLVLLWAGSDLLIFLSYTAIPIALLRVLRQRTEVPHGGLVALFASFILCADSPTRSASSRCGFRSIRGPAG